MNFLYQIKEFLRLICDDIAHVSKYTLKVFANDTRVRDIRYNNVTGFVSKSPELCEGHL